MRKILVGLLMALPLLVSPAAAPVHAKAPAPSITLDADPPVLDEGQTARLYGRVVGKYKLNEVRLQKQEAGKWRLIRKAKIANGRYSFTVQPPKGYPVYRVAGTLTSGKVIVSRKLTLRVVGAPQGMSLAEARAHILKETNQARAAQGLAPLEAMSALHTVAQDWTDHMAENHDFSHNPNYYNEYPPGWTGAAENIAVGQDPKDVVDAWMGSSGHRANILGDYTHIGIGYAKAANGRTYFTQNFARY